MDIESVARAHVPHDIIARYRSAAFDDQLERLINLLMVIEGNTELAVRHTADERRRVALSRVMMAADRAAVLAHEMLATVLRDD